MVPILILIIASCILPGCLCFTPIPSSTRSLQLNKPSSTQHNVIPEAYTHNFEDARGYYALGDTIVIKFSTLGQREYQFYDKKYNQIYSAGNPFATPVNIPTNISGGALGIWAGFSPSYDTLVCN